MNTENNNKRTGIRWALVLYDSIITIGIEILFLLFYGGSKLDLMSFITHGVVELFAIIGVRFAFNIYRTIWRYGGIQNYMKMMISDGVAFIIYLLVCRFIIPVDRISVVTMVAMSSMILLGSLVIRMTYRYAFKCGNKDTPFGRFLLWMLSTFGGINVTRFQER